MNPERLQEIVELCSRGPGRIARYCTRPIPSCGAKSSRCWRKIDQGCLIGASLVRWTIPQLRHWLRSHGWDLTRSKHPSGQVACARDRAIDTRLGRAVAIKTIHQKFSDRFAREARAISLLNHPNVCTIHGFTPVFDAYRQGDYWGALEIVSKINMPGFWRTQVVLAASYGQVGEVQQAAKALHAILNIRPDFAAVAREELDKWWKSELVERLVEGLRKAGLASR